MIGLLRGMWEKLENVSSKYYRISSGGNYVRMMTLPPSYSRKSRKSGVLTYRNPKGWLRPVAGKLYLFFFLNSVLLLLTE
jgi:hypothetical protein